MDLLDFYSFLRIREGGKKRAHSTFDLLAFCLFGTGEGEKKPPIGFFFTCHARKGEERKRKKRMITPHPRSKKKGSVCSCSKRKEKERERAHILSSHIWATAVEKKEVETDAEEGKAYPLFNLFPGSRYDADGGEKRKKGSGRSKSSQGKKGKKEEFPTEPRCPFETEQGGRLAITPSFWGKRGKKKKTRSSTPLYMRIHTDLYIGREGRIFSSIVPENPLSEDKGREGTGPGALADSK